MDIIAMNNNAIKTKGNVDLNSKPGFLTKNHFKKINPPTIRHILNESKTSVMGIATKNGIKHTKSSTDFSSEEAKTNKENKTVRGIIVARGNKPRATRKITTKPTRNVTLSDLSDLI